ncbi:MAG: type IV pilus twitching motility protein PilT [Planctomycetota bacterium]
MAIEINRLLDLVCEKQASDLHLTVGRPPTIRLHGTLLSVNLPVLVGDDTVRMMKSITSEKHQQDLQEKGGADFGFAFGAKARFRVSIYKQKGDVGIALRLLPAVFRSFEEIGLPPVIKDHLLKPRGMILVTGPTGSGKTTTLATMINFINENTSSHIITVEDPIEYYHTHKKSIVTQRELGVDVPSFAEALKRGLRMDPDVIMVGEMRDLDTMEAAITAAETGHLVFATLHTTGAARTVDRIVDAFPMGQQAQIRTQLSASLEAVVSQALLPTADGKGRAAAFEIMFMTPAIQNLIREDKTFRITSTIQTSAKQGMILLDDFMFDLFKRGIISHEELITKCQDIDTVTNMIREYTQRRAQH